MSAEPLRRRIPEWLLRLGAGLTAGAAVALFMSHPRWWPFPRWLDYALIATGVLAMTPWLVTAYRDRSWWRAYRKGRVSRDDYRAYRARRTGWPRQSA
jgi:hypothetical protein